MPVLPGKWWCPECDTEVDPKDVTFEETHDPRAGGCGGGVKWHEPDHDAGRDDA